jgi:hypothetical protein
MIEISFLKENQNLVRYFCGGVKYSQNFIIKCELNRYRSAIWKVGTNWSQVWPVGQCCLFQVPLATFTMTKAVILWVILYRGLLSGLTRFYQILMHRGILLYHIIKAPIEREVLYRNLILVNANP